MVSKLPNWQSTNTSRPTAHYISYILMLNLTTMILLQESKLEQYLVKCSGDDKFLLLYTLLKLNLLRGKNIIFVSDTNR